MPDFGGWIVGIGSILALYFLWKNVDSFGDGNIGAGDDHS